MIRGLNPRLVTLDSAIQAAPFGVNLSSDFFAEHESGIAGLADVFDLNSDPKVFGIDRRIIRRVPPGLKEFDFALNQTSGFYYLTYGDLWPWYKWELQKRKEETLRAAWDESGFGVVSDDPAEKKFFKELYGEFQKKNGVITRLKGTGIENPGLCLLIADRIPQATRDEWYDADEDRYILYEEMEKSGIEILLAEKDKRYFALSPKRQKDGNVLYLLNPYDQNKNKWGFYTLAELQEWAFDRGPIPIPEEKVEPEATDDADEWIEEGTPTDG
jgi:hypothetical protein